MNSKKIKFLLATLVILAVIFVYYNYFSGGNSEPVNNVAVIPTGAINETGIVRDNSGHEGSEVVEMLIKLRAIKMDAGFFENKSFNSLIDNSVELAPEPAGRANPFAPL